MVGCELKEQKPQIHWDLNLPPDTPVTIYHETGSLKQKKCILWHSWGSKVQSWCYWVEIQLPPEV